MKRLVVGIHQLKVLEIVKVLETGFIAEAKQHLEQKNIFKAVLSGVPRMLVLGACLAGSACRMRAGTAAAAIKKEVVGVNFSSAA